jgi:hypothetical protein
MNKVISTSSCSFFNAIAKQNAIAYETVVVNQNHHIANLVTRKSFSPWSIKELIPVLLLAISSTIPAASAAPLTSNPSNVRQLEEALTTLYTQEVGVPMESITCPDNANLSAGGTFECRATAQKVNFEVQVKIENNEGRFNSNTRGLLVLSKIEELIQKTAQDRSGVSVTADCGGKIRAAKTGDTFTCSVRNQQGQTTNAQVTVNDEQGTVNIISNLF